MKNITIILFFLFSTFNMAAATTVNQTNSAVFSVDTSALGAVDLTTFFYTTSGIGNDDRLLSGASMLLSFGSSAGMNDIDSYVLTNRSGFAINNLFTMISPITLPASLDLFYVTIGFINDVFSIETINFNNIFGGELQGINEGSVSVSAVPLPAAAWLFGSALLGFFGLSSRKSNA